MKTSTDEEGKPAMNIREADPRLLRRAEVHDLVRKAATLGRRVDGYFGDSVYYGVASPIDLSDGHPGIRFRWLGPKESHGEVVFTPELRIAESGVSDHVR
jgi:hypothetical protein